jgi:hypothetical protein
MMPVGPSASFVHSETSVARYSCQPCVQYGLTCRVPHGHRSCTSCARFSRRCVTSRSSMPTIRAIRSRVTKIRNELRGLLVNLEALDKGTLGDPIAADDGK